MVWVVRVVRVEESLKEISHVAGGDWEDVCDVHNAAGSQSGATRSS